MSTTHPFSTTIATPPLPPPQQQQQQHAHPNSRPPTTPNSNSNPNPNPPQGILYPVASSGRGFIPKLLRPNTNNASSDLVTVAAAYPPRPHHLLPRPHLDPHHHHHHVIRPHLNHHQHHHHHHQQQQQQHLLYHNAQIPPPIRGIPVSSPHPNPKAASSPSSISDSNGAKIPRGKRDETIAIIRDRKVRISDGASLYALCRSWLKNGLAEESQPQFGDGLKSLPRPLPMIVADTNVAKKREGGEEDDDDDDKQEDDKLSAQDLLKRHVKHAKRVRTRLREERAKRIDRYKTRLSLLLPLPPLVEQSRNDVPAGN